MKTNAKKIPFWYGPVWSTRALSAGINVVLFGYLTYYCTDMLGMSAGLVGGLLLASKLFDGFTDLVVGIIIDRTHTKWGKARPYEIFNILVWVFTLLLFSTPEFGMVGKAIWVFMLSVIVNAVCQTFLNASDTVYLARAVPDNENRVKVVSISGAIVMIGSIVMSIVFPQFLAGAGVAKAGWQMMCLQLGIPFGLIGMLRFLLIKEVVQEDQQATKKENQISVKDTALAIVHNKYILIFGAIMLLSLINTTFQTTVTSYYFKYIIHNIGLQSLIGMSSLASPLFLLICPVLMNKLGNVKTLRLGAAIGVIGCVIRILGGTNLATLFIANLMTTIGLMPITMLGTIFTIECMDYGEWKTGKRVEGAIASVTAFSIKVGGGLASAIAGIVLGLAGYNGQLEVQSKGVLSAISGLYYWAPFIICVIVLVLAFAYNINKIAPEMYAALKKSHKENEG